jgi:hypothetical protein
MAEGNGSQQEPVSKPYTTPKGYKPPTIGEQWRYVRAHSLQDVACGCVQHVVLGSALGTCLGGLQLVTHKRSRVHNAYWGGEGS